ncbi:hypothetical protein HELRODRAFT_162748 [Helobdella robusta]|uniref:Uncharacterized protein n=1 Tax=Helobdella robusta TaxID=6412 RepID=T1ET30_HELRO|nr:hypothetical protein HELRODRAFT_162748 [Helobdella robusta]ESN99233.1 hypothetical protein HELRODRAFT_162748 [Helobdella robusta]
MVNKCAAYGCKSGYKSNAAIDAENKVSFHSYPVNDPELCANDQIINLSLEEILDRLKKETSAPSGYQYQIFENSLVLYEIHFDNCCPHIKSSITIDEQKNISLFNKGREVSKSFVEGIINKKVDTMNQLLIVMARLKNLQTDHAKVTFDEAKAAAKQQLKCCLDSVDDKLSIKEIDDFIDVGIVEDTSIFEAANEIVQQLQSTASFAFSDPADGEACTIYYMSGAVAHSVLHTTRCDYCKEILVDDESICVDVHHLKEQVGGFDGACAAVLWSLILPLVTAMLSRQCN